VYSTIYNITNKKLYISFQCVTSIKQKYKDYIIITKINTYLIFLHNLTTFFTYLYIRDIDKIKTRDIL